MFFPAGNCGGDVGLVVVAGMPVSSSDFSVYTSFAIT